MMHKEEKWCTKTCVSWLKVLLLAFQISKYLKEAQRVYNKIHRGTLHFRNVVISYTSSIASQIRKKYKILRHFLCWRSCPIGSVILSDTISDKTSFGILFHHNLERMCWTAPLRMQTGLAYSSTAVGKKLRTVSMGLWILTYMFKSITIMQVKIIPTNSCRLKV